jgi:tripartite-type tricarboxylate transporter receptor subunit TctC
MNKKQSIITAFALVGMLAGFATAPRAQDFPTRPITIVVPFPPGGSIDVVLRAMAPKLQERLGQPIVVENRAGGGGVIGATAVAKAPPDGYMLYAAPSSFAANPKLARTLPYDTLKDFETVALLARTPLVLVVSPEVPAKSVPELVALLKQKPGEISFAHSGPGSSPHLSAELFQAMTGTKMNGVSYRGVVPGLRDVMAKHVALMFADAGSAMPQITAGTVRALGVTSSARLPAAPDIPTIAEAGVPGYHAESWLLMCVPAQTPKPVVARLYAALKAVAAMPEIRSVIVKFGNIPVDSAPPAQLHQFLRAEIERWGAILDPAGVGGGL